MRLLWFLTTFVVAWYALDRLAVTPPTPGPALLASAVAFAVLAVGLSVLGTPLRQVPVELGLGRPRTRALIAGGITGTLVFATYLLGAVAVDVDLHLRPDWLWVLFGVLLFHGLAEELVWRGFALGWLRHRMRFWPAVAWSIPLIAATHVPIIASNGALVGGLAVVSAAATSVPLAYLWEHGGRTIWGAAVLHGAIGCWQLFDRDYPASFSVVVLLASIGIPLLVLPLFARYLRDAPTNPSIHMPVPHPLKEHS